MTRPVLCAWLVGLCIAAGAAPVAPAEPPVRGLTAGAALASAYDAILDAEFDEAARHMAEACDDVPVFCDVMDAVALWWKVALDPDDRRHDAEFVRTVERAIERAEAWTKAEPERAEAWFARGAAYGVRAKWRVLRNDKLPAARDGKRIKHALERALALDPDLHDARFGLGLYRYYADVAPAGLRFLRWLLLLPGGDRDEGLRDMLQAYERGEVLRGEAEYQLHLVYLWYEDRPRHALELIENLQARYPHNPLFAIEEAHIHHEYFHDEDEAIATLESLIARAEADEINAPEVAARRARAMLETLQTRRRP